MTCIKRAGYLISKFKKNPHFLFSKSREKEFNCGNEIFFLRHKCCINRVLKLCSIRNYLIQYFHQTWHFCTISKSYVREKEIRWGTDKKSSIAKLRKWKFAKYSLVHGMKDPFGGFSHDVKKREASPEAGAEKEKNEKNCRYIEAHRAFADGA